MPSYLLNQTPIQPIEELEPPRPEDFPSITCKNASLLRIQGLVTPYVHQILLKMSALIDASPSAKRRYRFIDVKVHDLVAGQETANGLWHLDSSLNPVHEYDNLLFVSGEHALTEFIRSPLEIEHQASGVSFHRAIAQRDFVIERVPRCTIVRYNGSNVHRGPRASQAERRLLLRMVTTDHLLPVGRIISLVKD